MKFKPLFIAALCLSTSAFAANWSYHGSDGPKNWGENYSACQAGGNQSPINIMTKKTQPESNLPTLHFTLNQPASNIVDNGHAIQINFSAPFNQVMIGKTQFNLLQFHFHNPSENRVNHHHYPLEMHMVLQDSQNNMAVVAVFFKLGQPNPVLAQLWKQIPAKQGDMQDLSKANINYNGLLPSNLAYYHYDGSLTTPPCTHGLAWYVLKTPMTLSMEQIKQYQKYYRGNNRPVQKLEQTVYSGG